MGTRVVVPPQRQELVMQELHEGHPGICCMESLTRMLVWWPGLDKVCEDFIRMCHSCQVNQSSPPSVLVLV